MPADAAGLYITKSSAEMMLSLKTKQVLVDLEGDFWQLVQF